MDGKLLSLDAAWTVYDRFFDEERVCFSESRRAGARWGTIPCAIDW
ncbi:MAG TPA: hypothetical protein VK789_03040 [Bryobacteraceae bacterium]|nr:hypothetical protein [Bryobacteraceae bacterium]